MSYSLTDAGESEMRSELKLLEKLNEDLDQAASEAQGCDTLAPRLKAALALAWFISEEAMREAGHGSCGHSLAMSDLIRTSIKRTPCACCDHYREVGLATQMLRQRI